MPTVDDMMVGQCQLDHGSAECFAKRPHNLSRGRGLSRLTGSLGIGRCTSNIIPKTLSRGPYVAASKTPRLGTGTIPAGFCSNGFRTPCKSVAVTRLRPDRAPKESRSNRGDRRTWLPELKTKSCRNGTSLPSDCGIRSEGDGRSEFSTSPTTEK